MTTALHSLLEQAERHRDEAHAALLQGEDGARRARQQMDQLQAYHAEYAARTPTQRGRATSIDELRSHHAFMQRLDQAVAQQQGLLQAAEARVAQQRLLLLQRETRVASVRKLLQRRQAEAQRGALRQEQLRSDEAAAQRHWHDSAQRRAPSH